MQITNNSGFDLVQRTVTVEIRAISIEFLIFYEFLKNFINFCVWILAISDLSTQNIGTTVTIIKYQFNSGT